MIKKERVAMQRALAREAIGKLEAVTEFFGAEKCVDISNYSHDESVDDFTVWDGKISELKAWIFDESPIA